MKDCALAHYLDERATNLMQMISQNIYVELINYVISNADFLRKLAEDLRNLEFKALKFIYELCSVLKTLDVNYIDKVSIFASLNEYLIFEIMHEILTHFDLDENN